MRTWDGDDAVNGTVHAALWRGALPSLRNVVLRLMHERHRDVLALGLLRGMHELRLSLVCYDLKPQLEALGLVRQLPPWPSSTWRCQSLESMMKVTPLCGTARPSSHPPSRPCALTSGTSIRVNIYFIIGASGAAIERLEVSFFSEMWYLGDGLVHLAQALRCCSPTLKDFRLSTSPRGEIYLEKGSIGAAASAVGGRAGGRVCLSRAPGARAPAHQRGAPVPAQHCLPPPHPPRDVIRLRARQHARWVGWGCGS
jgi:hypothetical protein